jgi:hypothetical protein
LTTRSRLSKQGGLALGLVTVVLSAAALAIVRHYSTLAKRLAERIAASQDPAGATSWGAKWALASMISADVREILG